MPKVAPCGGSEVGDSASGRPGRGSENVSIETSVGFTREDSVLGKTSISLPEEGSTIAKRLLGVATGVFTSGLFAGERSSNGRLLDVLGLAQGNGFFLGVPLSVAGGGAGGGSCGGAVRCTMPTSSTPRSSRGCGCRRFGELVVDEAPVAVAPVAALGPLGASLGVVSADLPLALPPRPFRRLPGVPAAALGDGAAEGGAEGAAEPGVLGTALCGVFGAAQSAPSTAALNLSFALRSGPSEAVATANAALALCMATSSHWTRDLAEAFSRSFACSKWYLKAISVSFTCKRVWRSMSCSRKASFSRSSDAVRATSCGLTLESPGCLSMGPGIGSLA